MATNSNDKRIDPNGPDRNPDPITGAPGSHPTGTAIGSASGAATGAAIGSIGGPVGAAIGGIAGAVTGAVVGHKAGEAHDPTESLEGRAGTKHNDPVAAATNPKTGIDRPASERVRDGRIDAAD